MNLDGTHVRRLTQEVGYDGGAFFSPDSRRIVYRASHPRDAATVEQYQALLAQKLVEPGQLEIFVMHADGTGKRQISTTIPFLGSLSGQVELTVFIGAQTGVVGRIFLTLNASQIPGVTLAGDFLLEINSFGSAQTIQAFTVKTDASGRFDGFVYDAAGNPQVSQVTIAAGPPPGALVGFCEMN